LCSVDPEDVGGGKAPLLGRQAAGLAQ
jgi:hypothetical protein